jgi:hypothetical protein
MVDWKSNLSDFFDKQQQKAQVNERKQKETQLEAKNYLATEVAPALEELKSELEKHGRQVSVQIGTDSATITVAFEGNEEFDFTLQITSGSRVYPTTRFREKTDGKMYRAEGSFHSSNNTISNIKKDEIIKHFLEDYQKTVSR